MLRKMKVVETGYTNDPAIFVIGQTEEGAEVHSTLFCGSSYWKLTKKQCERVGKFLIEISK